jgi:hypothetical protein
MPQNAKQKNNARETTPGKQLLQVVECIIWGCPKDIQQLNIDSYMLKVVACRRAFETEADAQDEGQCERLRDVKRWTLRITVEALPDNN